MFEILGVLLCVGKLSVPNMDVCVVADDTWGPYNTQVACLARKHEIQATWPPMFAQLTGAPEVSLFMPKDVCKLGEPT